MNDDDDPTAGSAGGGNEADRLPCTSRVGSRARIRRRTYVDSFWWRGAAANGKQRHRTTIAMADNPVVATAFVIAMRGPPGDGLLRRLIDAHGRAAPPEAVHVCPPSDPCAGSDAGGAWEVSGFIAAAGRACRLVVVIVHRHISRRGT